MEKSIKTMSWENILRNTTEQSKENKVKRTTFSECISINP